ncbi:MAG TPA: hypothetical protein VGC65_07495 [Bacteroidia bacterium]|jgi:hypothetical protein
MKRIFTIAFIILTVTTLFGQSFEGKITYKNSYKSKLSNMKDEQFNSMMGTKQEYYIKGGNYKSVTNGTFSQWQIYINKDNKLYSKMSNSETVLWNDGSVNPDSIVKIQLNKDVTEILGYKCDELVLTCKSGTQKYYFNSKLGVDTEFYTNHKYGNWYDYLKNANSLPLKMIIDNQQFTMESVATEVKSIKQDAKEFKLPENSKTAKSPY